jgi:sulfur-oxidizing protein SoxX
MVAALLTALAVAPATASAAPGATGGAASLLDYTVRGDAVPAPLGGLSGDVDRGRAIVADRRLGNCLICHQFPLSDQPFQGEVGPPMAGVGARLSAGQIRLRLIDQSRLNPRTLMPPYYRVDGLTDVAPEYRGEPALTAQQIEDVVAYLVTLQARP